ncbi:kinase-like domain-containing protein [Gigaspora rosea]|uniref:Kinase-like domain-containing protein n=1 Tax=Gigaspora rosea TaxID=44941 RepID=A0A397W4G5_9GLOM|nr:kinase-like domain-containing protein [Gigaspora rosea]
MAMAIQLWKNREEFPRDKDELKAALKEAWASLGVSIFHVVADSVTRRIDALVVINMNPSEDQIQKCLIEGHVKFYEYTCFEDVELIGEGGYGKVYRATFKDNEITVALKSFKGNNISIKEIVNELKLHCRVDMHSNIIRLYEKQNLSFTHFMFVLEYADSGTLRSYLRNNFKYLSWYDKINFALQIASAIKCLHVEGIIHRDLHSNNILVHQKNIKLTDFGFSRRLDEATNSSQTFDIYSIGILMWEISSGYPPFKDDIEPYQLASLIIEIKNGLRENHIEGTHLHMLRSIQHNPNSRPDIQQFFSRLEDLSDNNHDINKIDQYFNTLKVHEPIHSVNHSNSSLFISDSTQDILTQYSSSSLLNYDIISDYEKRLLDLNKLLEIDPIMYKDSFVDFNKSLEIEPDNAYALKKRGASYSYLKKYKKSLVDLDRSLEIEPGDAFALKFRGNTYRMMKKYKESLADLNKSLEIEPNDVFALSRRGATYVKMGKYEESLADLNKSFVIEPNNARTLSFRGETYRKMGKYEESLADLNKSLEIEPNHVFALNNRGEVYRMMKKYEESLADLNKSLEIEPNNAWTLRQRGETYRMMENMKNRSLADLNTSLEIGPNNAFTLGMHEETCRIMNNHTKSSEIKIVSDKAIASKLKKNQGLVNEVLKI